MPTISLRLTVEEHAALKRWAEDSRRSLQKEAVYRLFAGARIVQGQVADQPVGPAQVVDEGWPVPVEERLAKPDFGSKLTRTSRS